MQIFDFLRILEPTLGSATTKIHLATTSGYSNPLDEFVAGGFPEWQRSQNRRNFELPHVLALIRLPEADQWLFAGVYESAGSVPHQDGTGFYYTLRELDSCAEFTGRLVAQFHRSGRQPYLNAASCADRILLSHIRQERTTLAHFPGYKSVDISRSQLQVIVTQDLESWRTALSSVAGVYLISDTTTGKLYVGSATGEGGIWQRWNAYAYGHGDNVQLRDLFDTLGPDRANAFRFSVLEIADTHSSKEDVIKREIHWKNVLLSRLHGWNSN